MISCRCSRRKRGRNSEKGRKSERGRKGRGRSYDKRFSDDDDDGDDDIDRDFDHDDDSYHSDDSDEEHRGKRGDEGLESLTMGFVINAARCRGTRKLVVEVARATLCLHRTIMQEMNYEFGEDLFYWELYGEKMAVFFANSYKRLAEIQRNARLLHIPICCTSKRGCSKNVCRKTILLALFSSEEIIRTAVGDLDKL